MTEAPALGDPTLDADHAKLADLVDRLAAAKGADVLASLDHPDRIAPAYHIWTGSKIRWLHINDDLPQYAQNGP